jgi:hypothetical protein
MEIESNELRGERGHDARAKADDDDRLVESGGWRR